MAVEYFTEAFANMARALGVGFQTAGHLGMPQRFLHAQKNRLGREEPLSDDAAITLIPFMLIVIQYTVDAERGKDLKTKFGIEVTGPGGGMWCVTVDGTSVSYEEGPVADCQAVFSFKPSEFVLSTYQRQRTGAVRGDTAMAERIRDLLFKI